MDEHPCNEASYPDRCFSLTTVWTAHSVAAYQNPIRLREMLDAPHTERYKLTHFYHHEPSHESHEKDETTQNGRDTPGLHLAIFIPLS